MNDRFIKFTERARNVLSLAQQAAQRFQQHYIGPEHLLLGLLREEHGTAVQVLTSLGITLDEARGGVEVLVERGESVGPGEVGMTPRAKRVIELAVDESRRMSHRYIGTEHLLLGLVREGESSATSALTSLGADSLTLERVRERTAQMLAAHGPGDAPLEATAAERRTWRHPSRAGHLVVRTAGRSRVAFYGTSVRPTLAERATIWLGAVLLGVSVAHGLADMAYGVLARVELSTPVAGALLGVACVIQLGGIVLAVRRTRLGYIITGLIGAAWMGAVAVDRLGTIFAPGDLRAEAVTQSLALAVIGLGALLTLSSAGALLSLISLQRRLRGKPHDDR